MHKILLLELCDEIFEPHSVSLLSQMDNSSFIAVIWDITYAFSHSLLSFQITMKF